MRRLSTMDDRGAERKAIPQIWSVIAGMNHDLFRNVNLTATHLAAALCIVAGLGWAPGAAGQLKPNPATMSYINPGAVAAPVRSFLFALGDRLQRPGKERVTLAGKYTDRSGTADIVLVWEVPGRLRFDRSDKPGRPVIYDNTRGWDNAGAIAPEEAGALESLFDYSPESFF